mmetsp:Transcript_10761/g.43375  ORF Transcript_10761/g.43375 Transcript_10761/m.43375 type:complete len:210 (-) Transcript_10761:383-1012(-)
MGSGSSRFRVDLRMLTRCANIASVCPVLHRIVSIPSKTSGKPTRATRHRANRATLAFTAFPARDVRPGSPAGDDNPSHDASRSVNVLSSPAFCQKSSSGLTSWPTVPEMTPDGETDPTHEVSASAKDRPRDPSGRTWSSSLRWHSCSSPCAACDMTHALAVAFHSTTWNTYPALESAPIGPGMLISPTHRRPGLNHARMPSFSEDGTSP